MKNALFLLSWCILVYATGAYAGCYDGEDACVQKMREILTDENLFWFGSEYATKCPPGSFTPSCMNADKDSKSILARVYQSKDPNELVKITNTNDNLQLADVTYQTNGGHYFGCGHTFEAPAVRFQLDPTTVTTLDSWSLDHTPSVRWDYDDNTFYTVVVWDVGSFYSHGIYINAKDGDLNTATPLDKYHGPRNPLFRPNVLIFAVFRQTQFLDPGVVAGIMGAILGANQGQLVMSDFLQQNTAISDMVAANLLTIDGDAYAMERMKNSYISNSCPRLFSRSDTFKAIIKGAGIDAAWVPEKTTLGYTVRSYLSTLTTDLQIEYSMPDDIVVDSCCVKTTFTKSLYRPDPLGDHVTKPALTSRAPRVQMSPINIFGSSFTSNENTAYTLLMVDMTDAAHQKPDQNLIVHWMVKNIKFPQLDTGEDVVPYMGPNPFSDDAPRAYVFLLLEQPTLDLDTSTISNFVGSSCPPVIAGRCEARVADMMKAWNMEKIVGLNWFLAEQDAYARKNLYSKFMVMNMMDACDGQPGYEDPCPEKQYCGAANGQAPVVSQITFLAVALLATFTSLANFV